jgi:hypothetical protein
LQQGSGVSHCRCREIEQQAAGSKWSILP